MALGSELGWEEVARNERYGRGEDGRGSREDAKAQKGEWWANKSGRTACSTRHRVEVGLGMDAEVDCQGVF